METAWNLKDICRIVDGALSGEGKLPINSIGTDSRNMLPSTGTMFVALRGERHDGHHYIDQLYKQGVRAFLVSLSVLSIELFHHVHLTQPFRQAPTVPKSN